jgi:hypothetical protein
MFEPILHELITLSVCGTLDERDLMKVVATQFFTHVLIKKNLNKDLHVAIT